MTATVAWKIMTMIGGFPSEADRLFLIYLGT